jgi:hypothetical protein
MGRGSLLVVGMLLRRTLINVALLRRISVASVLVLLVIWMGLVAHAKVLGLETEG